MEARHARYPFLTAAREAVGEADIDLAELVRGDDPAVERGRERVERALVEGTVETELDRVTTRTELLSYPVARVLVSLLDARGGIEKYAAAEAATAHERFVADRDGQASLTSRPVELAELLAEFDLGAAVREVADGYELSVGRYLELAPDGDEWRLVCRELDDGWVRVEPAELYDLLREAVERRVRAGLPLRVPDVIAEPLSPVVTELEGTLASVDYPRSFDRVDPAGFPPCLDALVRRARADEELDAGERFTLVSFLAYLGLDAQDVRDFCGRHGEAFTYTTERLAGEDGGGAYPPPSFATMRALGVCDHSDADHDGTVHPLTYYAAWLERDGEGGGNGDDSEHRGGEESDGGGDSEDGEGGTAPRPGNQGRDEGDADG